MSEKECVLSVYVLKIILNSSKYLLSRVVGGWGSDKHLWMSKVKIIGTKFLYEFLEPILIYIITREGELFVWQSLTNRNTTRGSYTSW